MRYGNTIEIRGETRGRTTYTVTVSGKIKDEFGQELGRDASLTFRVGPAESVLVGPGQNFVSLDPAVSKPVFSVYAINYNSLDVKIYAVQPSDWPAYLTYLRERNRRENSPSMPGRLLSDQSIRLNLPADTLGQVDIDLSPYTQNGFGHFALVISPPKPLIELDDARRQREYQTVFAWAQVTQIGLDVYFDNQNMVAWATDLQTGAPLDGVSINPEKGVSVSTGADGLARFRIPEGSSYLEARKGSDISHPAALDLLGPMSTGRRTPGLTACAGSSLMTAPCTAPAKKSISKAGFGASARGRKEMSVCPV
jgi:alpha-2-macroglobulin